MQYSYSPWIPAESLHFNHLDSFILNSLQWCAETKSQKLCKFILQCLLAFCYDGLVVNRDQILHCSKFELVSLVDYVVFLCSCREVTGAGTQPQSSVSHIGTADAADHHALLCTYLLSHMTSLFPSETGHITMMSLFIRAIPYLY